MIRVLVFLLIILPGFALAQNERAPEVPELAVEVIVAGGDGAAVYVQQQVLLKITLISRHPFRTLQIESPSIENAEMHVASRARTREFSTYGGSGWRHQRITALFPLRSGEWSLPSITASGSVVAPDGSVRGFEATSPARRIEVQPAHPYLNGFWWIPAEEVALTETYSRDLAGMKIGDTVRRTVRMIAKGTTAERLPELRQETTPGISVHEAGGSQTTRFTPDGGTAEIVRSWDITVNSEDPVNIAPVSVTWWHTGESRPASSGVQAGRIEPLAIDAEKLRADLMAEAAAARDSSAYALVALVVLMALPVAFLGTAFLLAAIPSGADLRLQRQVKTSRVEGLANALVRWGRSSIDPSIRTIGDLIRRAPTQVSEALRGVQSMAYGNSKAPVADLRALLRWSRHVRLLRLRLFIAGLARKALGGPVRS